MAKFQVLTGKAIAKAINSFEKTAATFAEKTHQIAYSALAHVEEHHDVIYLQALFSATPMNYRKAIVDWATGLGKVTFDAKALTFAYAKGKASDMATAFDVSPAEYARTTKGLKAQKSLMERAERMFAKAIEDESATREDKAFAKAMANAVALYKRSLTQKPAAPAKAKPVAKLVKAKAAAPEAVAA